MRVTVEENEYCTRSRFRGSCRRGTAAPRTGSWPSPLPLRGPPRTKYRRANTATCRRWRRPIARCSDQAGSGNRAAAAFTAIAADAGPHEGVGVAGCVAGAGEFDAGLGATAVVVLAFCAGLGRRSERGQGAVIQRERVNPAELFDPSCARRNGAFIRGRRRPVPLHSHFRSRRSGCVTRPCSAGSRCSSRRWSVGSVTFGVGGRRPPGCQRPQRLNASHHGRPLLTAPHGAR